MKKIIKPAIREESQYYSDFSGKSFDHLGPPVELKISFNYGSRYDGAELKLDLDDGEINPILESIKNNISDKAKTKLKTILEKYEKDFDDSMQMRDWDYCDMVSNNLSIWRNLLGIEENSEEVSQE